MLPEKTVSNKIGGPLLSWSLLIIAYATYGKFLHSSGATPIAWGLSALFALGLASMVTILWVPSRRFILMGFQSDVGYSIMVLLLASLAVLAVVQFRVFAYFLVLFAVSLLARVDTLISDCNNGLAFFLLSALAFVGLGVSWVPILLSTPQPELPL